MLAFATVNEEEAINQEVCLFVRLCVCVYQYLWCVCGRGGQSDRQTDRQTAEVCSRVFE